ncbi:unnamed protein product [Fraxinus pennsylvanica]|uniref:Uncharacterized protein n=1 Tax=Fraxinus pennsylvanica TaxID=56036 RepID=A0AAD1ZTW5_9LAMI|nr:unnamed protein product [Fraxinus pennsylvanica]
MTAANGVCKASSELVTQPSSYQNDQPKPDSDGIGHHNHQNNPDNLNAFVNGDSGLSEDLVVNKDVVELDSSVLSDSDLVQVQAVEFDAQNGELDPKSVKISELLNEGHDAVEGTNEILPEGNGIRQDQLNSLGDEGHEVTNGTNGILPVKNDTHQVQQNSLGDGVQGAADDTMDEQVGKTENGAAVEIKQVHDQTGKTESNAGDGIQQVQDQNGKTESLVEAKTEIEKVEDRTESESFSSSIENQESQARVMGLVTQFGENVELNNLSSDIIVSGDANGKCAGYNLKLASSLDVVTEAVECEDSDDKCVDHNLELASSTKSKVDTGSIDVVSEAVECESQKIEVGEVSSEDKIEELAEELVETSECQVPVTTSLHLDPKSWPLINEEKRETELESDVVENQKSGVTLDGNIEYSIKHGHKAENRTSFSRSWADIVRTLRETKIVHDPVFKGIKEKFPLSHAEDGDPRIKGLVEHPDCSEEFPKAVKSESWIDVSSEAHDPQPEIEISDAKRTEEVSTSSSDNPKLKIVENDPVVDNIILGCTTNDARSGSEKGISTASPKGSTDVMVAGENVSIEAATRPFFLIKIPKFNDGKLQEQIKHAQLEVDEKTRLRKVIQLEIQKTMNTHFRMYISDAAAARDCAFKKDREGLHRLCINQVEKIMELWNTNDEFRNEYVKQNARSTLTRFKTLDGRSLGSDEVPPILPGYVDERVGQLGLTLAKAGSVQSSTLELSEPKNCTATNKEPAKPVLRNASATVSRDDVINEIEKKAIKSKEEVELERKVEEELRDDAEPKSKNQLRLEEIAKAKLALEKKKRNVEKAQRRDELRAQKEAERKEKEREKRLRKKEKKKGASAAASEVNKNTNVCETVESSESLMENLKETDQINETNFATATTKRPPKISKTKYNIPPSIVCNRSKKKWKHWMWLILTCLIVVAIFLLGNTEDALEESQIYFVLPKTKLPYRLSASDMAALAVKASVALDKMNAASASSTNRRKRKARISPVMVLDQNIEKKSFVNNNNTMKPSTSARLGVSRSNSVKKLQRYSSRRAKMAARSFRIRLSTIHEGSVAYAPF